MLETIESTVNEYYKKEKSNSSSNDSTDSIKRRRDTNRDCNANVEDDDFTRSTGRSKKRVAKEPNKIAEISNYKEPDYNHCVDDDQDFYDYDFEMNGSDMKADQNEGRVLPPWSAPGNGMRS